LESSVKQQSRRNSALGLSEQQRLLTHCFEATRNIHQKTTKREWSHYFAFRPPLTIILLTVHLFKIEYSTNFSKKLFSNKKKNGESPDSCSRTSSSIADSTSNRPTRDPSPNLRIPHRSALHNNRQSLCPRGVDFGQRRELRKSRSILRIMQGIKRRNHF
jgi:hypothetical protein